MTTGLGGRLRNTRRWFSAGLLLLPNHCGSTASGESRAAAMAQAGAAQIVEEEDDVLRAWRRRKEKSELRQTRAERRQYLNKWYRYETFAHELRVRSARPAPWQGVDLGDGWGCGKHRDESYECWSTARDPSSGASIVAQRVPWLDGKSFSVGPDRLCVHESEARQLRCFRAPEFLEREPGATSPPDLSESWVVSYGPDSEPDFVHDPTPVSHGTVVGCRRGFCWGEASALPKPMCEAAGIRLPCALVDEPTLREFTHQGSFPRPDERVIPGDLFACKAVQYQGVYCVGASRDGFFGSPSECPKGLSSAWPSRNGPVAAPNVACARSPVLLQAGEFSGYWGSASPSGLCLDQRVNDDWVPVCFGEAAAPRAGLSSATVGLSDSPSGCGTDDSGRLYCWGAGYSRDDFGRVPVRVQRSPLQPSAVWDAQGPFHRGCMIQKDCGRSVRTLPACPPESDGLTPSALVALGDGFEGTRVSVRGSLQLTPVVWNTLEAIACGPFRGPMEPDEKRGGGMNHFCCPAQGDGSVVVTNGEENVIVAGPWCHGDSSRTCCSLPVFGQAVIATGVLKWQERAAVREGWTLKDPELCEVKADSPFTRLAAPSWPPSSAPLR